ncbi:MAG: hypothetical protein AAGA75_27160 [Cyanobacteria bacterium P01_E01_bin.6]
MSTRLRRLIQVSNADNMAIAIATVSTTIEHQRTHIDHSQE